MWKFNKDCEVKFYSLVTGKALRIRSNLSVDCLADDFDNDGKFVWNCILFSLYD